MNFRARLNELEQRREAATGETFRLVVRPVVWPTDLAKSTCKRTLCADGSLWEIVHLNGSSSDLSDGELERFIATFPIERAGNEQ